MLNLLLSGTKVGVRAFFISDFFELIIDKKWQNNHFNKTRKYYIVMAFFILLAFIYFPFDNTPVYFHQLLSRRFALFGFAAVGFFDVNNKFKLSYFLNTFFISSIIAILKLLLVRVGLMEFITNPERFDIFAVNRTEYVKMHRVFNLYFI